MCVCLRWAELSYCVFLSVCTVCQWQLSPKMWRLSPKIWWKYDWKWSRAARRKDVGEWGEKWWDCRRHGVPSPAVCAYSLSCRPRVCSTCTENTRVVSKSRTDRSQACLSCLVVKIGESPDNTGAAAAADTLDGRAKSRCSCRQWGCSNLFVRTPEGKTWRQRWRGLEVGLTQPYAAVFNFKVEGFLSGSSGHVYDLMSGNNRATWNVRNNAFHIVSSCVTRSKFTNALYNVFLHLEKKSPWQHYTPVSNQN